MKNKTLHPALSAIRRRQAGVLADAASNVGAKEEVTLPTSEAAPSQAERTPSSPTDGLDNMPAASRSDDGETPSTMAITQPIPTRINEEDLTAHITGNGEVQLAEVIETHVFNSTNLKEATFNPATKEMLVTFGGNKRFLYANVTKQLWDEFLEAKSAGSWFHNKIRQQPKAHPFKEVKGDG